MVFDYPDHPDSRPNLGKIRLPDEPVPEQHLVKRGAKPGQQVEARCGLRFTARPAKEIEDLPRCPACWPPPPRFAISA